MPLTDEQSAINSGTSATAAATLAATATTGRLLTARCNGDATQTIPAGWTRHARALNFCDLSSYHKLSDGSEGGISITLSGSTTWAIRLEEWSGNAASPLDRTGQTITPGAGTTIGVSTGTATDTADELALVAVGLFSANTTHSFDQSFTLQSESGTTHELACARRDLAATGVVATTDTLGASLGTNNKHATIATFRAAAGPTAAATGTQRVAGTASGAKQASQASAGQQRLAGVAARGEPTPAGPAVAQQRSAGITSGRRVALAATVGSQRTAGQTAGARRGAGVALGAPRLQTASQGRKVGAGGGISAQRTAGVAEHVPAVIPATGTVVAVGSQGAVIEQGSHGEVTIG